jgi:hypothetical protein
LLAATLRKLMDKLLATLDEKDLHVHQMPLEGAGEYVLHIGTAKTVESFAYRFDPDEGRVDDYPLEVFNPNN